MRKLAITIALVLMLALLAPLPALAQGAFHEGGCTVQDDMPRQGIVVIYGSYPGPGDAQSATQQACENYIQNAENADHGQTGYGGPPS